MTNAEANAARFTDLGQQTDKPNNFSDLVSGLYSSLGELTKSEQNKPSPDWLPKSEALLGSSEPHSVDRESINPSGAKSLSDPIEPGMNQKSANRHHSVNDNLDLSAGALKLDGIPQPKGDIPGPGSKEPTGEETPDYLRNPLNKMEIPPSGGNVPQLGGDYAGANSGSSSNQDGNANRDDHARGNKDSHTRTAAESEPAEGDRTATKDKPVDDAEARRAELARKAADILSSGTGLGNDYQRSQIRAMYQQALQGDPGAVAALTQAINQELERRGSDVRVSSNIDLPLPHMGGEMGIRLDVTKGSQKIDEMRVARPSPWESHPFADRLSR